MIPQDIADYKLTWQSTNATAVPVHSDLDVAGKNWCRRHLERQCWAFNPNTGVNQHTFLFENSASASQFILHFKLDTTSHT